MADETPAAGGTGEKTIPYDRFQAVVAERNELKGKLEEAGRQVQGLSEKAATADTLAAQLRETQGKWESERSAWGTERAIIGAGITDPEGVDFARLAYERVPAGADGKKPAITDWLGQREALPKAILAYLPAGAAQPDAQGQQQGQGAGAAQKGAQHGKPPPNANAGTKPFAGAPGTFTPDAIARMTPEQYRAARPAILQQGRGRG